MNQQHLDKISQNVARIGDSKFLESAFTFAALERKKRDRLNADNFKRVIVDEHDDLTRRIDYSLLQESISVRNVLKARRLASLLIDEKGVLKLSAF